MLKREKTKERAKAPIVVKTQPIRDIPPKGAKIAGAIKTNLLGNSRPVAKVDLLKFLGTVLNV